MPSLAEIGVRIGIPTDALAELLELPIVADAIRVAGENPHWAPNSIWKGVGRPTLYKDSSGLDLDPLFVELAKRRELATRSDGRINLTRLTHAGPITAGRLQKAESVARRRYEIIREVERLMTNHHAEPASMEKAKMLLREELKISEGGEL